MISEHLYHLYPKKNEGDLSKLRSQLISDKFLTILAQEINLGPLLILSYGEQKSEGHVKASNLANAFEALLGACYLDQGLEPTKHMYLNCLGSIEQRLNSIDFVDYKSVIQEKLQKHGLPLPQYTLIRTEGPDHDKHFYIEGTSTSKTFTLRTQASGKTKKEAEQAVAKLLLDLLNNTNL